MVTVAYTLIDDLSVVGGEVNLLKILTFAMNGERDSLIDNENNSSIAVINGQLTHQNTMKYLVKIVLILFK